MMTSAHQIAKGIMYVVKDYMIALKLALKEIWRRFKHQGGNLKGGSGFIKCSIRRLTKSKQNEILEKKWIGDLVPNWIVNKNLSMMSAAALLQEAYVEFETIRETEKAVFLKAVTSRGPVEFWCPKSVLKK